MSELTLDPIAEKKTTFTRGAHIAPLVVLSDGLPGCGKTMMSPIVSALDRVEMMRYNYALEHVCVLHHLKSISPDAADSMIKIQTDLDLYNLMMSRESNFRFSDLSSIWRDSSPMRYLKRLFGAGDAAVMPRIASERPILHLVTHSQLCTARALFDSLKDRLRIIEVIRHPSYMIKQWYAWMHRPGTDPRMFGLWIEHNGQSLPWFATGWEDLWLSSNKMDRTIYAIRFQWQLSEKTYASLSDVEKKQVVMVPFEQFVITPEPFMKQIETALGTRVTDTTRKMMKKQKVPRKMWADGINLKIYKHYGWEPAQKGSDERAGLEKRREFVKAEASVAGLAAWDELCKDYEKRFLGM